MINHVVVSLRPPNLPPANNALWDWFERSTLKSQRAFADYLGFPKVTLNHYMHARRRPSLERLDAIYQRTGIPVSLWLEPFVGKSKKRTKPTREKRQYLPTGNAHAS